MISDALHELETELDRYLDSADWRGHYGLDDDPLVRRLRRFREEARDLREYLDTPPSPGELAGRVFGQTRYVATGGPGGGAL